MSVMHWRIAECIFVIIGVHCLARYTLDSSCHIAQLAHKLRVGCYGIRLDGKGKPRKADGILGNVQRQFLCKECSCKRFFLILYQLFEVFQCRVRKAVLRHGNNQLFLRLLHFPGEALLLQVCEQTIDRFGVHAVGNAECSVLL